MSERIKLVSNDKRPQLVSSLTDENTGAPIDISAASVVLKFRQEGETENLFTASGSSLPGLEDENGDVSAAAPYDVPGVGGRVAFVFPDGALDGLSAGNYEGEITVIYPSGAELTVYDVEKFKVREDFK